MKNCEKIYALLCSRKTLVAEHTDVIHIPYPDPVFRGFQGGCSDGEIYAVCGRSVPVIYHFEPKIKT